MPPKGENYELKRAIEKNTELLEKNQHLLKKLNRYHVISAWFKVVWFAVLIGLPFALYFYILEPYFNALGSNFETFQVGISEIPGLKWFNELFGSGGG